MLHGGPPTCRKTPENRKVKLAGLGRFVKYSRLQANSQVRFPRISGYRPPQMEGILGFSLNHSGGLPHARICPSAFPVPAGLQSVTSSAPHPAQVENFLSVDVLVYRRVEVLGLRADDDGDLAVGLLGDRADRL